jgi:outer membrane protein assembly factor BamB
VCIRNQSTLVIIDWDTKELLWAWGRGVLRGPHDATVLPNGNILVFDNGRGGRNWSRVVEVDPARGELVWEYRAKDPYSFYTGTRGANQRMTNGNTLITESDTGRAFEVTADGEIVWEFLNSNLTDKREPSVIVRMRRYDGVEYEALARRVASGQLLNRVD